jgi:acetyltransferase-like isoleucine patch superfamily enzyme
MGIPKLRRSSRVAALYSWLQGTRIRTSGGGHVIERSDSVLRETAIEVRGQNCRLTIGPGARLWNCSISLVGDNIELSIGANCRLRESRLCVEDTGSRLLIGDETTMTGATLVSQEGRLLEVGRDCMIAKNTDLRNSDSHAIFDGSRGPHLNPAHNVLIGEHVWIGVGAIVFKGARIGAGSVIGAGSHVRGEIPDNCMAYGMPATPRRNGIRWQRERPPQ